MSTYNMLDAKTQLSRLVEAVESGRETEIVIARNGKPAARLVPLADNPRPRRLGIAKGLFESPDDIDGANEYILKMFNGELD
jgi:prevent-host-death family protein